MLKTRILTALVAIPLFLLVLFAGKTVFVLGWAALSWIAAREWLRLVQGTRAHMPDGGETALRFVALAALMLAAPDAGRWFLWALALPALYVWLKLVPAQLKRYGDDEYLEVHHALWPWAHVPVFDVFVLSGAYLYATQGGAKLLGLLVIIWAADTFAYTAGRLFGKTPLAPKISPKKTREGFIGGSLAALLAALVYQMMFEIPVPGWVFVPVSAVVIAYATVGDLWESVLKRARGVKDSGTILPGHGGMLDRIDSWLPSVFFWALLFSVFM